MGMPDEKERREEARRLLRENRDKLDAIVVQLLEHESLDEAAIYAAAGLPRPRGSRPRVAGPRA